MMMWLEQYVDMFAKNTSYLINTESFSNQLPGYSGVLSGDDSFLLSVNQIEQIFNFGLLNCVPVSVIHWLPASTRDLLKQFLEVRQQLD